MSSWAGQLADIAATRADVLIAGVGYATAAVGRYSVASILVTVCYQLSQTVLQRDLRALSERADRMRAYLWSVRRLLGANAVVAGAGVAVGAVLVPPLFGREFDRAIDYLPGVALLCLGLAVLAATLFDLSRHNSPALVPVLHGVLPALCCLLVVVVVPAPLEVMPMILGIMYLATGVVAVLAIRRAETGRAGAVARGAVGVGTVSSKDVVDGNR